MEKMRMESVDMTAKNVEKIAALFPNCVTEALDEEHSTPEHKVYKKVINFDMLRQMLSGEVLEGNEAFEFTWTGKRASIVEANKPIRMTLRPCPEESVNWDTTENLYIEGDNLNVLKLLQENYLGKIKMIYIDPPYNTGHDFIYQDHFAHTQDEENDLIGMFDEETGEQLFENTESNGRFHSDWCSMIYPRLMLARSLLADDGIIFLSIDDREVENLRNICNELFSRRNLLAMFCWKTDGNFDNQAKVKRCHEYILAYCKDINLFPSPPTIDPSIGKKSKIFNDEIRNTIIKNGPKNPVSDVYLPAGFPCDFEDGIIEKEKVVWPVYSENVIVKNGKTLHSVTASSGWASKAQLMEYISNGFNNIIDAKEQPTRFIITKTGAIEAIKERSDYQSYVISVLQGLGGTQKASADLGDLADFFDYPKPVLLLKYLISMVYDKTAIILDFFSGSASTAHAMMQINAEDNGKRKFIMAQIQEKCGENTKAAKAGFKNICEIGKERIRRAGKKIKDESPLTTQNLDVGFRVFKLDDTNMKDVYYSADEITQQALFGMESNIKEDRTDLDLLFGCLLDWGLSLSLPYTSEQIEGCTVHTYNDGDLVACFDENIPDSVIRNLAKRRYHEQCAIRAVFRDRCFANSPAKINVTEIFKLLSPDTRVKVI